MLGWSPGNDQEFFTLEELKKIFSISGLNKSPAIFDVNKLRWMNGEYIRKKSIEEFNELALPYYKESIKTRDIDFMKLSRLLHTRVEVLSEIPDSIDFIDELPDYKVEMYVHKKMKTNLENSLEHLKKSYEALKELSQWNEEQIYDCLKELIQQLGVKNGQIRGPIRPAVSGKQFTPGSYRAAGFAWQENP